MAEIKKNRETAAERLSPGKHFLISTAPALLAVMLMTVILFSEWAGNFSLASFGLRPREIRGIPGILFFPFLHSNLLHLVSNAFPFVLLSTLIYHSVRSIFWKIWGFTFLLSGIWTWCFARPGTVIGASAWVYALLGFLLVSGFAKLGRKMMIIAGGLAFLYGGMVYGLLPVKAEISWEGHLMGLLSGFAAAWYWRREIRQSHPELQKQNLSDQDASYPYWLYAQPHFIDAGRQLIHPDDLVWENGRPRVKTEEEKAAADTSPETGDAENIPKPENRATFRQGPWTITIGR